MMRLARRARRAVRLGYLTGRAVVHVLLSPDEIDSYCTRCNSLMERDVGGVRIVTGGRGCRECPVHVAWRELLKAGA